MTDARRSQAERTQAARNQVVQAALGVFALKGYAASSMDDIRLAGGSSKGGLYHHFPAKGAVLRGVVDHLALANALLPPPDETAVALSPPLTPQGLGRILIDAWAESQRDGALRSQLHSAYFEGPARNLLSTALLLGQIVNSLTRGEPEDAQDAARRLGIARAA